MPRRFRLWLDAVGHGVSDYVEQGIPKSCKHVGVETDVASERFETHVFLQRLGSVANSAALKCRENLGGRHKAQAIGCSMHLRKFSFDLVDSRSKATL